ncbi:hypothetical protein GM661_07815 [Iocasia frigidifontis]|uniref:Uncharacterized protein n=1 Tax=Iocasia fonsfrigidae TaxID=2682810 RepID=A0A8A7K7X8_9FIRM|nr:hypothetical protein [Iocasia fonsfrigidae]MTI61214.1 hypothetical protein [Bacillota bacterium]QTL97893.1 hypothetical protein GM661_07815 [Iocasia fonsfrigidae]
MKVKKEDDEKELFKLLNEMIKYSFGISLKAVSREKLKNIIDEKELLKVLLQVMDYMENMKGIQDREGLSLKDKIKEIYQKIR